MRMTREQQPLVCIHCLTYNHEAFLEDALKGFVMQQTNFHFIAVVIDDASSDGTADVLRRYEKQYPEIIKAIYLEENYHSQGLSKQPLFHPYDQQVKYIAHCEGDDYWTDPSKLQKQFDFLEANPEYSMCFHNVKIFLQDKRQFVNDYITRDVPEDTDIFELAKGNFIHTPSVFYRRNNAVFEELESIGRVTPTDYVRNMLNAKYGKIHKIKDCMAVYRVHSGGVWSIQDPIRTCSQISEMLIRIKPYFSKEVQKILQQQYIDGFHMVFKLGQDEVRRSKTYRLGRMIQCPFTTIRKGKHQKK